MSRNNRLLIAFHSHVVPTKEFLEKSKCLEGLTGQERIAKQDELADWIEATYPLREFKYPRGREATETEKRIVNVVFGDSIHNSLIQACRDYEVLEPLSTIILNQTHLDMGLINEPEDSDYRRIASWRLVFAYMNESDEELIEWSEHDSGWEMLHKAMESNDPLRIWYSEEPGELCGFYFLCTLLKDYAGEVYAVKAPERVWYEDKKEYRLVNSTGSLDPDNVGKAALNSVKLSSGEIGLYAEEWERLKEENAPLRAVISGRVVSVNAGFYDPLIWNYVPESPIRVKDFFRNAQCGMPYVSEGWLALRLQAMIGRGMIEVVQDNKNPELRLICRKKIEPDKKR